VSVTTASPPLVLAVPLLSAPRLVVKLIVVPSATALPYWSVAVAVNVLVLPTDTVSATALSVSEKGAPGVKVTRAVALRPPTADVTTARPEMVELSVAVATPPTVVAVTGETLPRLVVKLTTVPSAAGSPLEMVTVAVSKTLLPTTVIVGLVVNVMVVGGAASKSNNVIWLPTPTRKPSA
jgi:hypothetical protein